MQINAAKKMGPRIPFRKGPKLGLSDEKLISQILRRIIGSAPQNCTPAKKTSQ